MPPVGRDDQARFEVARSVQVREGLPTDGFTRLWNDNPQPFTWTKTADEILERLASYLDRIPARLPQLMLVLDTESGV